MSILAFVQPFPSLLFPNCYGAAVYVRARNCRSTQFHWLSRPMTYHQARMCARLVAYRRIRPGKMVTLPDGRIGQVEGLFYADPVTDKVVCSVVPDDDGPALVVAAEELKFALTANAIKELTELYGYRDITKCVRSREQHLEMENREGGAGYLCVLQRPQQGETPLYYLNEHAVLLEIDAARTNGRYYRQCPTPDPEEGRV